MIRFLLISFLSILVLSSCSLKTTEGLREVKYKESIPMPSEVKNPYFSNPEIDYVYKAKIEVYKKNFGGILIIKKTAPKSHRIVFTTEFGTKLFDFQFQDDTFIVNYIVEELNKKFIVNILRQDFQLLVNENTQVLAVYEANNQNVFKTQTEKRFNFYFYKDGLDTLEKIVNTSKNREKMEIGFTTSEEDIAESIAIKHNNIKLKIDLKKFKQD